MSSLSGSKSPAQLNFWWHNYLVNPIRPGLFWSVRSLGGTISTRSFWSPVSPDILVLKQWWKFVTLKHFLAICRVYNTFFNKRCINLCAKWHFSWTRIFSGFCFKCERKSREIDGFARLSRTFNAKCLRLPRLMSFSVIKTTTYSQLFYDLNSVLTSNVSDCQRVKFDFLTVTTLLILRPYIIIHERTKIKHCRRRVGKLLVFQKSFKFLISKMLTF